MGYVVHKMRNQVPKTFFGLQVVLAAYMAVAAVKLCITVEANFFFAFF